MTHYRTRIANILKQNKKRLIISLILGLLGAVISYYTATAETFPEKLLPWGLVPAVFVSVAFGPLCGFVSCLPLPAVFCSLLIFGHAAALPLTSLLILLLILLFTTAAGYISRITFQKPRLCFICLIFNGGLIAAALLLKDAFSSLIGLAIFFYVSRMALTVNSVRTFLKLPPFPDKNSYKFFRILIPVLTFSFAFMGNPSASSAIASGNTAIAIGDAVTAFGTSNAMQLILLKMCLCLGAGDILFFSYIYREQKKNPEKSGAMDDKKSLYNKSEQMAIRDALFESSDDIIWYIDGDSGCLISGNKNFYRYFSQKWRRKPIRGSYFLDYCSNYNERQMWNSCFSQVKRFEKFTTDYLDEANDTIFELRFYLLRGNLMRNIIAVFAKDITKDKKLTIKIQEINKELELKVEERTRDLQTAYSELESFSYVVSHDLKTPIRAISAYNNMIIEDNLNDLSADATEAVYGIRNICDNALLMIQGLLAYHRAQTQELSLTEIDTSAFIRDICKNVFGTDRNEKLELNIADLPKLQVDPLLFRQVIENIISNALKYSSKRDKQIISIAYMENSSDYVIYFKDNGAGFDMSHSDKLFKIFQRLHSDSEFEGSGIGLATVKCIIQKHGGEVFIFSKPDKGCVIGFSLPKSYCSTLI